jgi:chromosome segregation ATPase
MKCRCDGCAKSFDTKQYAFYCDNCNDPSEETPVTDDSNCHCGPCTAMNEPLTLEGDIRYLKAHIETKDRQLADAEKRVDIYKGAWRDAESAALRLDEKNAQLLTRITELEDALVRLGADKPSLGHNLGLQQENERLKVELEASRGQVRNQLGIILDLRKEKETLIGDRTSLMEEADGLYDKLGRIATIVDEIVD